jgi:hypothetical protein
MIDLRKLLAFALEKYPERVETVPLEELVIESARQNAKRPAFVKLAVPDELVKELRGRHRGRRRVFLVAVPDEIEKRVDSRIVLPGEIER